MLRIRRRLVPTLILAMAATTIVTVPALAGCVKDTAFAERHCVINDNPRVASNRVVTLYAWNYIYVGDSPSRDDHIARVRRLIDQAYNKANQIFTQSHANVLVANLIIAEQNNPDLNTITLFDTPGLQPEAEKRQAAMTEVHQGRSKYIGVHWPQTVVDSGSSTGHYVQAASPCSSEECNWVLMGGYHDTSSFGVDVEKRARDLAHGLGKYFNLKNSSEPANLMFSNESATGRQLKTEQRATMWVAINTGRITLRSVTCDPPEVFAPVELPKVS